MATYPCKSSEWLFRSRRKKLPWSSCPNCSSSSTLIVMGRSTTLSSSLAAWRTQWFSKSKTWRLPSACWTKMTMAGSKRSSCCSSSNVRLLICREQPSHRQRCYWGDDQYLRQEWRRVHRLQGVCGKYIQTVKQWSILNMNMWNLYNL